MFWPIFPNFYHLWTDGVTMFLAGSAGRKSNICELGCRSLNGRCQVLDVKVTSANAAILTRNLKSGALFIAHHHHVPDRQIKRELLRVFWGCMWKWRRWAGRGEGMQLSWSARLPLLRSSRPKWRNGMFIQLSRQFLRKMPKGASEQALIWIHCMAIFLHEPLC